MRAPPGLASRSSRSPTRCAPTSRSCSAPRPEERGAGRRDLRRLAADLLHAADGDTYNEWLDEGFARSGASAAEDFEICATANIVITDDRAAAFAAMKPYLALYMGGMGAEDTNFHADVYRRMGYAEVVDDVTTLFRADRKEKRRTSSRRARRRRRDRRRPRPRARADQGVEAAGVTMMCVSGRNAEQIRQLATLI